MTTGEKPAKTYRCARCNRKLRDGRWIFSRFTKQRYCWPGECKAEKK